MADHRIEIKGSPGRRLDFAVERLGDGAFHDPRTDSWRRPRGRAHYARMDDDGQGLYACLLPKLDPSQDYQVHVVDVATQQLVANQLLDGDARMIQAPRGGTRSGTPEPRNEYHGGFVVGVRSGRHIELE